MSSFTFKNFLLCGMAVFRPLRASYSALQWQISAKRTLGFKRALKTDDEELRFKPKPLSTHMQVFVEKPVLDKEIHKNFHFFHLLRGQLEIILNKKIETLLKSLENGDLVVSEFDKIAARIGLHKLTADEISRFFPQPSSFYPYLTYDQENKRIDVYVSNKEILSRKRNTSLFGIFTKHNRYDKAVVLISDPIDKKVILKGFVNLPANDTPAILPGSRIRGSVPYKLLLSSLVGLSLGSATSAAVSKILYLPSDALVDLSAASILACAYVWGKWKDSQISLLMDKRSTLDECGFVDGSVSIRLAKNEVVSKLFLEVLTVYSFLLRERGDSMEKGDNSGRLIVDAYFLRKFNKWTLEELDFKPSKCFSFDEIVQLLAELGMAEKGKEPNLLRVTPFKELLSKLQNKEASFSDRFDLQY